MADNHSQKPPPRPASEENLGWAALGYLLAGMGVWGFLGWLADQWLGVPKHFGLMVGMLLGTAGGVYLVVKRLGR